jgi:hypothetical protein
MSQQPAGGAGAAGRAAAGSAAEPCGRARTLLRAAIDRVGGEGADAEDRRKRPFLVVALGVLIPVLSAYGFADLLGGETVASLPPLLLAAILALTLALGRRIPRVEHAARILIPVTLAFLVREIVTGGGEGFVFLWAYLLPVWVFFIFGRREGALWAALIGVAVGGGLAAGSHPFPAALVSRFVVTYLLVSLFAYALEEARAASADALLARQEALEKALREIKTLTGLLPICCACKKIRDDRGAWSRLEDYLEEHTEAELTHGICPECIGQLYPDLAERMKARAAAGQPPARHVPPPPV